MYKLKPPKVFAMERVKENPLWMERMNCILSAINFPVESIVWAKDEDIPQLIKENNWKNARTMQGKLKELKDPVMFFSTARWNENNLGVMNRDSGKGGFSYDPSHEKEAKEIIEKCPKGTPGSIIRFLLGQGTMQLVHERDGKPAKEGMTCRPTFEIHTMNGCPHKCLYCGYGQFLGVNLNVEDFIQKVDILVKLNPWCKVFRYDIDGEALSLEPEFGAIKLLVEHFAKIEDRYFLIHTKSANVDCLLNLEHRGHTMIVWSLTSSTVTKEFEKDSGTTEEILESASKCEKAGYTVRYKFKPMVPVKNWREETKQMIKQLFEKTHPDVLSMCMLAWMSYDALVQCFDISKFDQDYLKKAENAKKEMKDVRAGPFPHDVRKEIYEFFIDEIRNYDREVPVSISTETPEMWKELGPKLGFKPNDYVCGCGPQCIPHLKQLNINPWEIAQPKVMGIGLDGKPA